MNEIITADCDINENGLIAYFGGNGDVYITVSTVDENGIRTYNPVRISTSGGSCPANIKIAAAELVRAFEENEECHESETTVFKMSKSKEYKAIKNYIHNELGLTKEDIIKELDPILKRIMHQYMNNAYGCDNDLEGWVKRTVEAEIKRVGYDFVRDMYLNALKYTIADSLEITIRHKEKNQYRKE